jgi:hypothetical protein
MTTRENIIDKNVFDVFPDNPEELLPKSTTSLRASLNRVLKNKTVDEMDYIKYDIQNPLSKGGGFEERYLRTINSPILDSSNNVAHIIQLVDDVTENKELISSNNKLEKNIKLLAESYEFSEEIIAAMMEPMLVLSEDLKIKSASNSFC